MTNAIDFANGLKIIHSLDAHELGNPPWYPQFRDRPVDYFLRCADSEADQIWTAMVKRGADKSHRATFVKEKFGAVVATILENEFSVVEVQRHADGKHTLTIHHRREDRDSFEDLSAHLEPKHFEMLGSIPAIALPEEGGA